MRLLDVRVRRSRPDRLGATRSWTVRPLEFRHCAQADKQRHDRLGAIDNRAVDAAIDTVGHAVPPPSPNVLVSDGKPRDSSLTIPALGIEALPVKVYQGSPDDARGTRIQNRGIAASPYGPDGGVG